MMAPMLTPRQLDALRLDLTDRQHELVDEVYRLSRGLLTEARAPKDFADELLDAGDAPRPWRADDGGRLAERVARLWRVTRALKRLQRGDYGRCRACGRDMPFEILAVDSARERCAACGDEACDGSEAR